MLRHIDPLLSPELLFVLKSIGHGDDLLICDSNQPAASIAKHTVHGRVIPIFDADLPTLSMALQHHFPLDSFVDEPTFRMEVVGAPEQIVEAHYAVQVAADGRTASR